MRPKRDSTGWILIAIAAASIGLSSQATVQNPPPAVQVQGQTGLPQPTPQPKGTGLVTGQVVDAFGVGVPDAIVLIQGGYRPIALTTDNREIPGGPRQTITTANGYFAFFDLTPGTYAFDANKPGYLTGAFGRLRPGGLPQSINLKDGERYTGMRITVWEYASLSGTVRDESGEAIVGVQVRALQRTLVSGRWLWNLASAATTNDRGDYRIDSLLPGRYVVVVASTQSSTPLTQSLQSSTDAQMQLMRAGISPAAPLGRQIGSWLWNTSSRTAMAIPDPVDESRTLIYPTTFYPSARSSREAEMITLESGQERRGVDLQMQLVPAASMSGVVTSGGRPLPGQAIKLQPDYVEELSGDMRGLETSVTVTDTSGSFLFVGVPAGRYIVQSELFPPPQPNGGISTEPGGWLNDPLVVDEGGMAGMTLVLRPTVTVSGRIAFDGTKPPPAAELIPRFTVSLETIGFAVNRIEAPYAATFDKNGQFTIPRVPPGTYVATFRAALADRRLMPDWELKNLTVNGRDVSDHLMTITGDVTDLLVTLTDHNQQLSGTVRDPSGKPDPNAAVLVFTAETELWPYRMPRRIRMLRSSETGAFSVRGVPPGDYFILAVPDVEVGDYPDPVMLEQLRRLAAPMTMTVGEQKTLDLVVRSIKR
jgi:protocatechuate 3,4-dioxygenase beta subunit